MSTEMIGAMAPISHIAISSFYYIIILRIIYMENIMNKLAEILTKSSEFTKILNSVKNNSVVINGLSDVQKRHFAFSVSENLKRPFIFVVQNEMEVKNAISDLELFTEKEVEFFPAEDIFMASGTKSKDIASKRAKVFEQFLLGNTPNLAVSTSLFLNKFSNINDYKKQVFTLRTGDIQKIEDIGDKLIKYGYERAEAVDGIGQFAIRGGILDLYSPNSNEPARIEFFDDEIDSVRIFNVLSQRTIEQRKEINIFPVKNLEENNQDVSFFECLPENYLIFCDEPQRMIDKIDSAIFEYTEKLVDNKDDSEKGNKIFSKEYILNTLIEKNTIFLSTMDTRLKDFSKTEKYFIISREITGFGNSFEKLVSTIKEWKDSGNRIILFAGNKTKASNIVKELQYSGIDSFYVEKITRLPEFGSVCVTNGNLTGGFEYPDIKTIVISDRELFGMGKAKKVNRKEEKKGLSINVDNLKHGEYIVHNKHDIGTYNMSSFAYAIFM
jgi:transcription-repair coupling factor (superfamily II helicase)